jgi:crotonobetainyl-CoA:carnitine CoA-transferase CaiB-like acyl-CoA transferase
MSRLPLEGVRVLDLTMITAGPNATLYLADLGAEVIKVESARHPDQFRSYGGRLYKGEGRPWDHSPPFLVLNRNKRGLSLNLTHPLGKAVFLRLAAVSDVVAENFRANVMSRLGLGYEVVRDVNHAVIMVAIGSQGKAGPEANYGSYGLAMDALSGLASLTGYRGGPPTWSAGVNYPDQVASIFAVGLILAAIRHRWRTGEGGYIDFSQREFTTNLIGEAVLEYTLAGHVAERQGNRHRSMAPHGCFPCVGDDRWVTVAVGSDAEWAALCEAMDQPDLAVDPRFATVLARKRNEDALEPLVAAWTRTRDRDEVTELLQSRGIAAGPVYSGKDLLENPHLRARGFVEMVKENGFGELPLKRVVPRFSWAEPAISKRAPALGEESEAILRDLLGVNEAEIEELRREGVIDTVPKGAADWQVP